MQAHLLFSGHHILVARTEDLIHLGHRLRTIGHGSDSLNTTGLEDLADASDTGGYENGGIHLAVTSWRRTEHNLLTTCNLGGCGEHQHGREEGSGTTGDIESHLLDGDALLPTGDTRLCLHFLAFELLGLVEGVDVIMGELDGSLQFGTDQSLGLFHLLFRDGKCRQVYVVELQFIAFHGIVTTFPDVSQHGSHRIVQLRHIEVRSLHDLRPLASLGISNYIHILISTQRYRGTELDLKDEYLCVFVPLCFKLNNHFLDGSNQDALGTHLL